MNNKLDKTYKKFKKETPETANKRISSTIRNSQDLYNELLVKTSFLFETASKYERLYCYINNIHSIQICPYCGNPLKYKDKVDKGYYNYFKNSCELLVVN